MFNRSQNHACHIKYLLAIIILHQTICLFSKKLWFNFSETSKNLNSVKVCRITVTSINSTWDFWIYEALSWAVLLESETKKVRRCKFTSRALRFLARSLSISKATFSTILRGWFFTRLNRRLSSLYICGEFFQKIAQRR